jgi:hypothetical protein
MVIRTTEVRGARTLRDATRVSAVEKAQVTLELFHVDEDANGERTV